jgi:hypothetical protein
VNGVEGKTHPVLEWPLDGENYDAIVVYRVRQTPSDAGTQQVFQCKSSDYMSYRHGAVRIDKERKLLILETYEYDRWEEARETTILKSELLVPIEEVIAIVAQRREEIYGEPDNLGPLLCWPEDKLPLVKALITAGFKP